MRLLSPTRLVAALTAATLLAAAPVGLKLTAEGVSFQPTAAFAKHGADDTKPDDRGGKRGGRGRGADDAVPHGAGHP